MKHDVWQTWTRVPLKLTDIVLYKLLFLAVSYYH